MDRYVCVHGHFYQPPRENPWLEAIETQDSAYPYHDWNDRIDAECYAANASSRILDERDRIVEIVNNYSRISFDFGPTLLSWMERKAPETYAAVLAADRESRVRFSGHGSALAHAYNHPILPLANRRDKRTQVLWGIADFRRRFEREPEGMWLPETAADLETLEVLAESGVRFTILAPHQAARGRPAGGEWGEVPAEGIDPTQAYRLPLPSGRVIDVFFYHGPISRAVAFEGLLNSGERFASRLLEGFSDAPERPQLLHIATDGETYGHHHRHGDMALAYALRAIESSGAARLTNYGEFLERHPPLREVEIRENTSWSCAHGLERWRGGCGCATGAHPGWSQTWRGPLREALDELRDGVAAPWEEKARPLLEDPWRARDDYVRVMLDRSPQSVGRFFAEHAKRELSTEEGVAVSKLLELQRHAMLMYTSCGWFFDDISGIEAVQVLQYAGRAVQLAEELFGDSFEARLLSTVEKAKSNRPEEGDGRRIYERRVRPARVDLVKVGGHYAVGSLFEERPAQTRIYCYGVEREDIEVVEAGRTKLLLGRARFTSVITGESDRLAFGALHMGDQNVGGGVRRFGSEEEYGKLVAGAVEAFSRADLAEVLRLLDAGFGPEVLSLKLLFRDEQRRILRAILDSTREEAEAVLRQIHQDHVPLLRFAADLGSTLPRVFRATAEFVLNADLRRAFARDEVDPARVTVLLEEAARENVALDEETLEYAFRQRIEALAEGFAESPEDAGRLERLRGAVELARRLPFPVRLWKVQNLFWRILRTAYPRVRVRSQAGEQGAREWIERFTALAEGLSVRVEPPGEARLEG